MHGRVKQLYKERYGNSPWVSCEEERYSELERVAPIDRAFALSRLGSSGSSSSLLFLAYLFGATRIGHLCVEVAGDRITPSPEELGWQEWSWAIAQGAHELARQEVEGVVCVDSRWYLERYALAEERVAHGVKEWLQSEATLGIDLPASLSLLPEQVEAVHHAVGQRLTLICGGPGTGKSFTATTLIREASRQGKRVAVCAPTGKAIANLRKGLNGLERVELKTIHALLGLRGGWAFDLAPKPIGADLVVVDEASMIDIALFAQLFRALKPGSHLVLMGDPDQLPPVEAGSLFADLVEALPASTVRLTCCMRTDLQPIVALATAVREGDVDGVLALLKGGGPVCFRSVESPGEVAGAIWVRPQKFLTVPSGCGGHLDRSAPHPGTSTLGSSRSSRPGSPHRGSHLPGLSEDVPIWPLSDGQRILTPLRKGVWGCDHLNALVGERLVRTARLGEELSLPIMVTRNDYKLDLFNGEVGQLFVPATRSYHHLLRCAEGRALFEGREETIPAPLLPSCEIAFAISVHKAQGSEFDRVIIVIPPSAEGWGKELLYTAITRAKREVEILGSIEELSRVVALSVRRHSGMVARLAQLCLQTQGEL